MHKIKDRVPDNAVALNIILVCDDYIHKLNKQFLNKDRPTDVLSFLIQDKVWGEIYISRDRARVQARQEKISIEQEIFNLIAHGILHLANYSHREMKKIRRELNR
ncbi:MAG: rRNA maturation RNase YbeY [Candidatus Latescibacteria bacterium]|nr:rRNA maturation RNase YbeY [Candidatus Latescibacterota bacterium]